MLRTNRRLKVVEDGTVKYDPFADDDPPLPKLKTPDPHEQLDALVQRIEREAYERGWSDAQASHLDHGVFYTVVTAPGQHRLHHNLGTSHVMLSARADDLEQLTETRPDFVRRDDGDENTVVIETDETVRYPVKVKIVQA